MGWEAIADYYINTPYPLYPTYTLPPAEQEIPETEKETEYEK